MDKMRLDKYLCDMTSYTRSSIKDILKDKRVKVNELVVKDGAYKVKDDEKVYLDDQLISYVEYEYYLLNKPQGYLSANDDKRYPCIVELIKSKRKDLFPVGRLDLDTLGAIIITNDGELSHRLISPKYHVDKKYYVQTTIPLKENVEEEFKKPMDLGDFITKPCIFERISDNEAYLTIHEGKFHQVKRMFDYVGSPVSLLKRVEFAFLNVDDLQVGEYRALKEDEIQKLKELANL